MTSRKGLHFAATVIGSGFVASIAIGLTAAFGGCFVGIDEGLLDASGDASSAQSDSAASHDAGDAAAYLGVPCGDAPCAPPVSVCCSSTFGDTDYRRGSCTTRDTCKTGDFMACTAASDCRYPGAAGPYCCVIRLPGGAYTQTACSAACDGGADASNVLCTEGDDTTCPPGSICRASLEFPLLFSCVP